MSRVLDFWDDLKVPIIGTIVGILILAGIGFSVVGCTIHDTHVTCLRLHENTGLPTKVARSGANSECYIQTTDGHWIPEDRYRGVEGS